MKAPALISSTILLGLVLSPMAAAQTANWTEFGTGCPGQAGVPQLISAGFDLPYVGDTFATELSNLPATGAAVGFLGLSDTTWGVIPLPASLVPFLPLGCTLYVEGRFTTSLNIVAGRASWERAIPDNPDLHGLCFYQQALVLDPTVSGLISAVMSNAGKGVIENFSGNLSIKVLGGVMGTSPQVGIRVLIHDQGTGAVLDDRLTGPAGIANFGILRTARTTFSIVLPPASPGEPGILSTIMDAPVGALTVLAGPEPSPQVSFNVNMTGVPLDADDAFVLTGGPDIGDTIEPFFITPPTINVANVDIPYLQNDGLFSLMTEAGIEGDGTTACGLLLDVNPASITGGSTIGIATSTSPSSVPFTANMPVFTDGTIQRRKGLLFETGVYMDEVSSGNFSYCAIPGADKIGFAFAAFTSNAFIGAFPIYNSAPASINVTMPDLDVLSLNRSSDGQRFSWTLSGSDVPSLDLTELYLEWQDPNTFGDMEWNIALPADATSVALPKLPLDLAMFQPPLGVGYGIEVIDLDTVNGYQDMVIQISSGGGSLESVALNASLFRSVGAEGF